MSQPDAFTRDLPEGFVAQVVHRLPGRMRIKSVILKHRPDQIQAAVFKLLQLDGIETVRGKAAAGSLTITYDEKIIRPGQILAALARFGFSGPIIQLGQGAPKPMPPWVAPALKIAAVIAIQVALPKIVRHFLGGRAGKLIDVLI